ncbi:hypothetical protein AG1IA_04476 [Rhizoctonia solani AG-1 IA]|uniref:Uncharacterized protein n=1 Tax=Thanatephorus cucumeris (strain AG1-IA) TaxID=983506 RepID=L8WYP4_THACA|nr:hypothetical protein AG1IA_04476 [Rhizoctonia solani AG-1 IA]
MTGRSRHIQPVRLKSGVSSEYRAPALFVPATSSCAPHQPRAKNQLLSMNPYWDQHLHHTLLPLNVSRLSTSRRVPYCVCHPRSLSMGTELLEPRKGFCRSKAESSGFPKAVAPTTVRVHTPLD